MGHQANINSLVTDDVSPKHRRFRCSRKRFFCLSTAETQPIKDAATNFDADISAIAECHSSKEKGGPFLFSYGYYTLFKKYFRLTEYSVVILNSGVKKEI